MKVGDNFFAKQLYKI